jgi:hypothetical protein
MNVKHRLTVYVTLDVSPPVLDRVDRLLTDLEKWLAPKPGPDTIVGITDQPDSPRPK